MTPRRWFLLGLVLRLLPEALCLVLWFQVQALLPSDRGAVGGDVHALPVAQAGVVVNVGGHPHAGERRQDWRTPRAMFDALQAEYGFDMDGAADADSGLLIRRSTVDAPESWIGRRVFCNPPWSE